MIEIIIVNDNNILPVPIPSAATIDNIIIEE